MRKWDQEGSTLMNRAAQQRAAIRRLTTALATPLPAGDVQQIVVEEARRLTDAASAALCLFGDDQEFLDFVAVAGENAQEIVGLRIKVADSLSATVAATRRPVILDSRHTVESPSLFPDLAPRSETAVPVIPGLAAPPEPAPAPVPTAVLDGERGARSAAIVPVFRAGRFLGTLSALNKNNGESGAPSFDADDLDVLTMLAEFAALAQTVEHSNRTTREQSRELDVLYDAARTVAGSLNVQAVMNSVLAAICTHLEHHTAVLFLLNDERTHLFIAAEHGLTEEEREVQLSVEHGLPARVLDSGHPLLVTDADTETDFEDISERALALSAMMAPIRSRDETHGLILVSSLQRQAYHADDLKLLAAVATQAGIAIENAWLYEDAQRQAEQASALYDLSQHVNSTLHLDRVLNFVADSVLNLLNVDKFALMLYDAKSETLVTRVSRHVDEESFGSVRPRIGEGIAGWVYEWQTPQAISDISADPRNRTAPIDQAGVASTLCVPMHVGDDVIGVIHAMSSKRRLFTVTEMELLYTISNQAAVATKNAMVYQGARARSYEMRRYFRRIAQALGAALDDQDMPRLLAMLSLEMMRADRCALYRLDGDELRLQASSGFRGSTPPDAVVPLGVGLTGWTARRGHSLTVPGLDEDSRSRAHVWLNRDKLSSYLGVPLKSGRRTVGVIEIYTQAPRDFTKEEAQLLSTFARRSRVADKLVLTSVSS